MAAGHDTEITNVQTKSVCYFKTRSGGFKEYDLNIVENEIVFSRPNSSKQAELKYALNSIQCVKKPNGTKDDKFVAEKAITGEFCLMLISSATQQRSIYFDTKESLTQCHEKILGGQGFLNTRIEQYEPIGKLGAGSFGTVMLVKHKNSDIKFAVKIIGKTKIDKAFKGNGQVFQELEIMEELARENCENILEVIETFEDDESYYVVTKLMAAGDLFNYICLQPTQPLEEDLTKKIIRQVATGVQELHSRNIIHRDIKIENILMSDNSDNATLKIGDLGSAVKLESA